MECLWLWVEKKKKKNHVSYPNDIQAMGGGKNKQTFNAYRLTEMTQ